MPTDLAAELQDNIDKGYARLREAGIEWSADRQAQYHAACVSFYRASVAKNDAEMRDALAVVKRMEAEGGLL